MTAYHFVDCGLDNVYVDGIRTERDESGEDILVIPAYDDLHRAIAGALLTQTASLSGDDVRFLRIELELQQKELGALLHRDGLAVSRWERGVSTMDPNTETVLRLMAANRLGIELGADVERVSSWTQPGDRPRHVFVRTGDGYRVERADSGSPGRRPKAAAGATARAVKQTRAA